MRLYRLSALIGMLVALMALCFISGALTQAIGRNIWKSAKVLRISLLKRMLKNPYAVLNKKTRTSSRRVFVLS